MPTLISMMRHDVGSGVERGGQGGGASAPGPGPVVGARAKLDFLLLFFLIGSQWGILDFDFGLATLGMI